METIKVMRYIDVRPKDLEVIIENVRVDLTNLKDILNLPSSRISRDKKKQLDPSRLRLNIFVEVLDPRMSMADVLIRP